MLTLYKLSADWHCQLQREQLCFPCNCNALKYLVASASEGQSSVSSLLALLSSMSHVRYCRPRVHYHMHGTASGHHVQVSSFLSLVFILQWVFVLMLYDNKQLDKPLCKLIQIILVAKIVILTAKDLCAFASLSPCALHVSMHCALLIIHNIFPRVPLEQFMVAIAEVACKLLT